MPIPNVLPSHRFFIFMLQNMAAQPRGPAYARLTDYSVVTWCLPTTLYRFPHAPSKSKQKIIHLRDLPWRQRIESRLVFFRQHSTDKTRCGCGLAEMVKDGTMVDTTSSTSEKCGVIARVARTVTHDGREPTWSPSSERRDGDGEQRVCLFRPLKHTHFPPTPTLSTAGVHTR